MTQQAPGFYRRRAGDWVVTAVNDGYLELPPAVLAGLGEDEVAAMMAAQFRTGIRGSVNVFVLQGGGRTVLIDTGAGDGMGPTLGHLLANLDAAGVRPGDVDLVLMTHLHPDHSGGLATKGGGAVFPKAELALAAEEAAFWLDDAVLSRAPEERKAVVLGTRAAVAPYRSRVRLLGGADAAPGITRVPLPGHTPGHSGYRVGDGADALLIWGDVMHVPAVQATRPEIGVVFDIDPAEAVATRQRVLDLVAAERLAVAGMHLDFPGFVHVARRDRGFELVPEMWSPVV